MIHRTIETSSAFIGMIKEDILCIRFKPNVMLDLEQLSENRRAIFDLIKNRKVYILSVPYNDTLITKEFRETFTIGEARDFKKAEAVVITSLAQNLLAKNVKQRAPLDYPLETFNDEVKALQWLGCLKEEENRIRNISEDAKKD